jgi:hypothetical protein
VHAYDGAVTLQAFQPDAMAALDAAYERVCAVVDPDVLAHVSERIEWTLAGAPEPPAPADARAADVAAVVDQMLIDVAQLDDDTVRRASAHFPDGGLADLVMAAYILEARTRLRLASDRLLGCSL